MAESFSRPAVPDIIRDDINAMRALFGYLAKLDPSLGADYPADSIRLVHDKTDNSWVVQWYNGSTWANLGRLNMDVQSLQGHTPSTSAVANAIPVYNSSGKLVGNITGAANTAAKLATPRSIQVGGILSSTAQNFDGSVNITIPVNQVTINNVNDNAVNGTLTKAHGGTGRTDGAAADVRVNSISGEIGAKSVGQIGDAVNKGVVNADTLVATGNYIVNTSTDTAANHWPYDLGNSAPCRVVRCGVLVYQTLYDEKSTWARLSINSGASWREWTPQYQGTSSATINIYLSKSGSDANTGLDSGYPVLTFARAKSIANGIAENGNNLFSIKFCFGTGEWGDINLRAARYWASIYPYDGVAPTANLSSLPQFDTITYEMTAGTIAGVKAGQIVARYKAFLYLVAGYKAVGALHSYYGSMLLLQSQDAATNKLAFMNTNATTARGIVVSHESGIYIGTIHFELSQNIDYSDGHFFSIGYNGRAFVYGNVVFNATSYTYTGKRLYIAPGAMLATTNNTAKSIAPLDQIWGTGEVLLYPGSIINGMPYGAAIANDVVTLAGAQTITGLKSIQARGGDGILTNRISTDIDRGIPATTAKYLSDYYRDKNNNALGRTGILQEANGNIDYEISVNGQDGGACRSYFWVAPGGQFYLSLAQNPPSNSNTTHSATTNWVRARIAEATANLISTLAPVHNASANTALSGSFMATAANCGLSGDSWFYIHQFFDGSVTATSPRTQIATGYSTNQMFVRHFRGSWSSWTQIADNANAFRVGDIRFSLRPDDRSGYLMCSGAEVSRTTYANLYNVIGTAYGAGDGSTTFNLPNFQNKWPYVAAYSDTALATMLAAGLPNITGTFQVRQYVVTSPTENNTNGVWKRTKNTDNPERFPTSGNGATDSIAFDASRSNSIYGNSTTVQPPSFKVYAWIKY